MAHQITGIIRPRNSALGLFRLIPTLADQSARPFSSGPSLE